MYTVKNLTINRKRANIQINTNLHEWKQFEYALNYVTL